MRKFANPAEKKGKKRDSHGFCILSIEGEEKKKSSSRWGRGVRPRFFVLQKKARRKKRK